MCVQHARNGGCTASLIFSGKKEHQLTLSFEPEMKGIIMILSHQNGLVLLRTKSWRIAMSQEWQADAKKHCFHDTQRKELAH